jgi:ABC-type dipeptide/oligopeptide/nickel transport system permease component
MPVAILALGLMAATMRLTRSAMLDVLDSEYIKLARATGVPERTVIWKHALRNAALPVVTVWGLQIGRLLSGAVVIEMIFAWPGVGRLTLQSISARDYPVVQVAVLITACTVVLANFLVDILYVYIDPRIKLGAR